VAKVFKYNTKTAPLVFADIYNGEPLRTLADILLRSFWRKRRLNIFREWGMHVKLRQCEVLLRNNKILGIYTIFHW